MNNLGTKSANTVNGSCNGSQTERRDPVENSCSVPAGSSQKIERSIAYMMQHLDKPLHVAKLATLANISPSHYFALFKRRIGCAPIDFFIRLRMQHACELLDGTSLSVKEIAAELGYDDPFYFSRTFKSVNRIAPSAYRTMPDKLKNTVKSAVLAGTANGQAVKAAANLSAQIRSRASAISDFKIMGSND